MNQSVNRRSPLWRSRRFAPLFWAQFGGAFNDNLYKSALLMYFTYKGYENWGLGVDSINNIAAAIMILPFLFFPSFIAQYADKQEKSALILRVKWAECAIMALVGVALWLENSLVLLLLLLCTGAQSSCFSPLKYSVVPQHVDKDELVAANGLLYLGTSMAIFLGLIVGSILAQLPASEWLLSAGLLIVAFVGLCAARKIPLAQSHDPELKLERNPVRQSLRTLRIARQCPVLFFAIIGIGWYWFLGSIYLTQLPNLSRSVLGAGPVWVTVFLMVFLLGVALGSWLSSKLSAGKVDPGIVPIGALGILLIGVLMAWLLSDYTASYGVVEGLISAESLLARPQFLALLACFVGLGGAGGMYIVPLVALMQSRAQDHQRAQVVGAGNIVNAAFMAAAAILGAATLGYFQWSIAQLFYWVALVHCLVAALIFSRVPDFSQALWQRLNRDTCD